MIICDICKSEQENIILDHDLIINDKQKKPITVTIKLDLCKECVVKISNMKERKLWVNILKRVVAEQERINKQNKENPNE